MNKPYNSSNRTVLLVINYIKYSDSINFLQSLIDTGLNNADIIILDNASGNDSVSVLRKWIKGHFPVQGSDILNADSFNLTEPSCAGKVRTEFVRGRVALFSSTENFGFSGGNNVLAHIANSLGYEYFYFLNSDIIFTDPLSVSKLEALHDADPNAYVSGPTVINLNGTFDSPFRRDSFWGDAIFYGPVNRMRRFFGLPMIQFDIDALSKPAGAQVYKISGAAMFFPSARFLEIEGFDENVWLSSEEAILGEKVLKASGKVMYLPTTVLLHVKASAPRPKSNKVDILSNHFRQRNYYYRTYRGFSGWQMALLRIGQKLRLMLAKI